ncbi:DUF1861 family protein [Cohnella sp. GCM10012308]|uniref:DUF1861 family protein n=1 Tax=Cohnella sp. GCM10012308 TaxID=3317329 RepID=UPI0036148E38
MRQQLAQVEGADDVAPLQLGTVHFLDRPAVAARDVATTGPEGMKDIRLVELADGRIGVFSRPKGMDILARYGSLSMIGFTVVDSLDRLTPEAVGQAPLLHGLFGPGEWGGCNQAYLLDGGLIGVIGHHGYKNVSENGEDLLSYMCVSFVLDPSTGEWSDYRVIGTRPCYPDGPAKRPRLADCAFAAGIEPRADGKVDLYSGIGDTETGRLLIDDPFAAHGRIVTACVLPSFAPARAPL